MTPSSRRRSNARMLPRPDGRVGTTARIARSAKGLVLGTDCAVTRPYRVVARAHLQARVGPRAKGHFYVKGRSLFAGFCVLADDGRVGFAAMIDRFVHRAEILALKRRFSCRLKDKDTRRSARLAQPGLAGRGTSADAIARDMQPARGLAPRSGTLGSAGRAVLRNSGTGSESHSRRSELICDASRDMF
jgi:hypothetical protein